MSLLIKRFDQMVKLGGFDVNAEGPAEIRGALLKIEATEALATEAGEALGVYAECWCNRESRVDDEGNEHLVEEPCGVCAILAKLAAAGLLPASQEEREG